MKVKVVENLCIGCGACQSLVPDVFEVGDRGVAEATKTVVEGEQAEEVKVAKDNCPTGAIDTEEETSTISEE